MTSINLPTGWTARPPQDSDEQGVVSMLNERTFKLEGRRPYTIEYIRDWWRSPRFSAASDFRVVRDDHNTVAALAAADDRGAPFASIGCIASVHPQYEENQALWDALYAWSLRRVSEIAIQAENDIRVVAAEQVVGSDEVRRAALKRAGFTAVRTMNFMGLDFSEAPPAPVWPDGITWRTADPIADREIIVDTRHEIWMDHWGAIDRPREDRLKSYDRRMEDEGDLFEPSLQVLAFDGDEIAGLAVTRGHRAGDTSKGFIGFLGVRRPWRRRGLGQALLHHAFCQLHQMKRVRVELEVDSENLTGAVRLYERAGMRLFRQTVSYEKEVRKGVDPITRDLAQ